MHDDPIAVLERELVQAARRQAVSVDEREGSQEPRGPWPSAPRPARRRSSQGGFAVVVLSAVAVVVAVGALVSLRGHTSSPTPASHPATAVPGRQRLIDILGVLRRPQTSADLDSPAIARFLRRDHPHPGRPGTVDLALIRRATVTPWGAGVFLIPLKPPAGSHPAEGVTLFVDSGGSCCATAADIERYGDTTTEGAGRPFAGGATQARIVTVVPDGVATVDFVVSRQPDPTDPGAPIYRSVLTIAVPVHGNVAAVEVHRECCDAGTSMIWKAADGRVIRRIGNPAAAGRVVAPPRPGPETAASRAAERDPSTPNRVWVTPSAGGPRTIFSVHFQVLLNDADYRYRVTGTACPRYTFAGGSGGGPNDIRGRVLGESLTAVQGQPLCPGTYHVSVAVMDLGRYGNLKHPARPFGTATFTVRP